MFLGIVATVLLNPKTVTVMEFEHRVLKVVSSVDKTRIYKKLSKDKRTLVLQPLSQKLEGNLVVMTTGGTYNFDFQLNGKPHRSIYVVNGEEDSQFEVKVDKLAYSIHTSSTSVLLTNKLRNKIIVNSQEIEGGGSKVFPMGPPIFIQNERVFQ
jgi:hypothetical protein